MKTLTSALFILCYWSTFAQTDSFVVDGTPRSFNVHLPAGYSAANAYPLILNLHGYTSNASDQESYSRMDAVADTAKFIVVYPNGLFVSGQRYWNAYGVGADDVKFLSQLIDSMERRYHVDPSMVYSCGLSNGGYMSYTLACELENRLAAVAAVAATISQHTRNNCLLERKMPVLDIHGTADPIVNYTTGAANTLGVEATVAFWRDTNDCSIPGDTVNVPNTNTGDLCSAQRIHYPNCSAPAEVLFFKITNGGHTWPGGLIDIPAFGNTCRDFNASIEIWNFFKKHKRTTVGIENAPVLPFQVWPNPSQGEVQVQFEDRPLPLSLYDIHGRLLWQKTDPQLRELISIKHLDRGLYILKAGNAEKRIVY
ncbi:MAG: PHB depolymerase family esterase [Chitinophagales bacterium]